MKRALPHFSAIRRNPSDKGHVIDKNMQKIVLILAVKPCAKTVSWSCPSGANGSLHAFVTVARAGGFREGARLTGGGASSLSEAVRRLVAEGALTLSSSGRISTPELTPERIEELAAIRALLEPEMAARALPRALSTLLRIQ